MEVDVYQLLGECSTATSAEIALREVQLVLYVLKSGGPVPVPGLSAQDEQARRFDVTALQRCVELLRIHVRHQVAIDDELERRFSALHFGLRPQLEEDECP